MKHFKYILLLLPLLYYSCTNDILQDLDTVAAQNEEQDARLDSLLTIITDQQEYIDSLNTTQQAYIDSLHNAQQTTLTALANSALNAGFTETQVFSGTLVADAWTDLDLSSAVGQKTSLVLLKINAPNTPSNSCIVYMRSNGDTSEFHDLGLGSYNSNGVSVVHLNSWTGQETALSLLYTDSQGIIEYQSISNTTATISVVFYLNQ